MDISEKYTAKHTGPEDELLAELARETEIKKMHPRMLSGKVQGKLLEFLSKMLRPRAILEIGTFTGYSALCLSKGLDKNGELHTIEINDEHESMILKYFKKSAQANQLKLHVGKAEDIIPTLNKSFDLIFIDADKRDYLNYYKAAFEKLNIGGFIIADNVFWSGKVFHPTEPNDESTAGIKEFNEFVRKDSRTEQVMLPIRDGISIIRKISNS
ncbi:MAG: O-methyltransferase [Bacteroidota bacterium]|nr:O-methyltransferase [Bacteroidota bacterium]